MGNLFRHIAAILLILALRVPLNAVKPIDPTAKAKALSTQKKSAFKGDIPFQAYKIQPKNQLTPSMRQINRFQHRHTHSETKGIPVQKAGSEAPK